MSGFSRNIETDQRRSAMLRTAFCSVVRDALADPLTIEIMANPDGRVWIEQAGKGIIQSHEHLDSAARERVIRLVASSVGERSSPSSNIVSAELPGSGERFEGCLPPISEAPCFSIRKPAASPYSLQDYLDQGVLSPPIAWALERAAAERANIVIAGGTSSGKTTLANALLADPGFQQDRLVILEDTRELRSPAPNSVQLRTERGKTSLQELVRSTLRLRPDRIVVGEVRGGEALDLLKAWSTGHPGGITTLHANSAYGALTRLEQLTLEATPRAAFDLIAEAIDVIVFMERENGARRISEAIKVTGFDGSGYQTEPLVSPSFSLVENGEVS